MSPLPAFPFDAPIHDLDAMFCTVDTRLRRGPLRGGMPEPGALHSMLAQGDESRRRIEQIVDAAQAALTRAPAEFAGLLDLTLRASPIGRLRVLAKEPARTPARKPAHTT